MEVIFSRSYLKDLRSLPKRIVESADEVVEKLRKSPSIEQVDIDIQKMKGQKRGENYYRIRIGTYRIIAEYIAPNIIMLLIGKRGDVYK